MFFSHTVQFLDYKFDSSLVRNLSRISDSIGDPSFLIGNFTYLIGKPLFQILGIQSSSRKYYYYRRPIGVPSETDKPDRRPKACRSPRGVSVSVVSPIRHVGLRWDMLVFDEACQGLRWVSNQACQSPIGLRWVPIRHVGLQLVFNRSPLGLR